MRVLPFSKYFPAYHPRKGEPTHFVEKVLKSLYPETTYYPCCCENCGWIGMSNLCGGGGSIADTGDFFDPTCPRCYSTDLEGDTGSFSYMDRYYLEDCGDPKFHTIRAGERWEPGDKFSARIWAGAPYRSKQIEFAQIEVKRTWRITIEPASILWMHVDDKLWNKPYDTLANNDGLDSQDFIDWIVKPNKKPFTGQIICWNDKIEY